MDKFIRQLLLEYSKVILPEFGAITIANEETGELMFQEFLKYDDGKLAALLEQESNMDLQESKNAVAKFVREMKYSIDKGETYSIFQLGELYKNDKDEYIFNGNIKTGKATPREEEVKLEDSFEKLKQKADEWTEKNSPVEKEETEPQPSSIEEKVVETPLEKDSPKIIEEEKEVVEKPIEPLKETSLESIEKPKENTYIPPVNEKVETSKEVKQEFQEEIKEEIKEVIVEKAEKPKENIYIPPTLDTQDEVKTEENKAKEDIEVVAPIMTDSTPEKSTKKRKKKPMFFVFIVFFALIIGGLVYGYLNKDTIEEYFGWNQFATVDENKETAKEEKIIEEESAPVVDEEEYIEEEEEEVIEDEHEAEEVKPEPAPMPVPSSPVDESLKFHVITGTFGDVNNANKMVENLNEKGLKAKVIGQYGGLHYVSGGSYATNEEAQQNLSSIKEISGGGWIFNSK